MHVYDGMETKTYTKCMKSWKKTYRKAQNNLEDIWQLLSESFARHYPSDLRHSLTIRDFDL